MATYQVPLVQTNEEFLYKVMNSDKPVLLNFTAVAWCHLIGGEEAETEGKR